MKTAIVIPARYASHTSARQTAVARDRQVPHPARLRTRLPVAPGRGGHRRHRRFAHRGRRRELRRPGRPDAPRSPQRHRPRRRGRPGTRRRCHRQPAGRRAAHRSGDPRSAARPAAPRSRRRHGHAGRADRVGWSSGTTPTASRWSAMRPAEPCTSAAARSPTSATASPTSPPDRRASFSTSACTPIAGRFCFSLAACRPHPLEELEKLEQLRVLALGQRIHVGVVPHAARGVDTFDDYQHFVPGVPAAGAWPSRVIAAMGRRGRQPVTRGSATFGGLACDGRSIVTPTQLSALLVELLALPHETEWVEWSTTTPTRS